MGVNRDKVDLWKADVARSVDFYNQWFMAFAPQAFRETRIETTKRVERALLLTENLTDIRPETLQANPSVLPMLRMATCPPIARDRLIGLAGVSPNLVKNMEDEQRISPMMKASELLEQLNGSKITFDLFLCGYFDSGYLGYEAAEGIDWVWEHRIDDLAQFGF